MSGKFSKVAAAVKGLFLSFGSIRTFDKNILKNKRIALVGPATSAFGNRLGKYIDDFDVIVRVNKSAYTVEEGRFAEDIGTRTDILYHCFLENTQSGGGPLDFEMYAKQGIQYVINPRFEFSGLRNTFNFYKKYLTGQTTYVLPAGFYKKIRASVKDVRPTTGFSALYTLMESDFKELYITGFTFFKTAYGEGYKDHMKQANQANSFIKSVGLHDPDKEYEAFKQLLAKHKNKNIKMDAELTAILQNN